MTENGKIYIATVLLEKNRWEDGQANRPSVLVSEWIERFAEAGFDGMELWEKHATQCSEEELARLEASSLPVAIFNTYATMDDAASPARDKAVELTKRLGAGGVKYNIGRDQAQRDSYLKNLTAWRKLFPAETELLCECHPGSIVEEPAVARAFFDQAGPDEWRLIVHPLTRFETLKDWFKHFGPAVRHAHIQMRDDDRKTVRIDRRPDVAREAIHIMREEGFAGSFTIEFTEGVGEPDENIETLFENARADLECLKEILS